MFSTIRRHQNWLLIVVAIVTIASFVVFGPSSCNRVGDSSRGGDYGTFDGHRITAAQMETARRNVKLGYLLQKGQWITNDSSEVDLEALKQVAFSQKQKELGIQISDEAVASEARRLLQMFKTPFDVFVDNALKPHGLDASDFDHFIRSELGQRQMVESVGLTGRMVTPQEAEALYRTEHQEMATDLVYFATTNFLSSVSVTPDDLAKYYTNQISSYKVPEQVQIGYVKFDATNYLATAKAKATNVDQYVDSRMKQIGTNYVQYGKTPEEARANIKSSGLHEVALGEARRDAGQFAEDLDKSTNRSYAGFEEFAKAKGLKVQAAAPFSLRDGPHDLNAPEGFGRVAFSLTPEDPFSGAIKGEDGVYVLAFKQKIPPQIPSLKSVEAKVTADYREAQARELSHQAATKFDTSLTNGLAQGKTFKAIADDAKVKYEALPAISLRTETLPAEIENKVALNALKQVAFTTPVGKASPVVPVRDGVFVLYTEKQLPVDEAKMKADLPAYTANLRDSRHNEAFNEWITDQVRQDPAFFQRIQKMSMDAQMAAAGRPGS